MSKFSTSLTLGKASGLHGANVEHNNRDFIADNIDTARIADNITYARQDVRQAYQELFGDALQEYNDKQKRSDRKIDDYYTHIQNGKREEAFYELIVQFGDSKTAGVGTSNGTTAQRLLDEYMRSFKERNPNLHVFNAVCHMDEASPHLHINIIPFYTEGRKNGLSKGVSMRAALDEQGFSNSSKKANSLVEWEDSERDVMEQILRKYGLSRNHKNAKYAHMNLPEYKKSQDEKSLFEQSRNRQSPELTADNFRKLERNVSLLQAENAQLNTAKFSPWKCFFYSVPEKQAFVMAQLTEMNIPIRETENGFEAQEIYVEQIRKLEKQFKPANTSHREVLRETLDKIIMQSKSYDEVLQRLRDSDCEVKQGKYTAVKPKYGSGFIRLKSLGEDYSEQAIQRRLVQKSHFEQNIDSKISTSKNSDSLETMTNKSIRHYTVVFAAGVLPVRKKNKKKPFAWTNDEHLDRLAELNKRINAGATLTSLRNEFAGLDKSVAEKESKLAELKSELAFFNDLYNKGERCFKFYHEDNSDLAFLAEHKVTAENYERITQLITANESEIAELEKSLPVEQANLRNTSELLTAFEKIASGVYVQSLIDEHKPKLQSEYVRNGLKRAD